MTRRLSELADPELEQALSELATEIAFPGAPEIAIAVRGRLLAAPRPSPWWRLYPDSRRLRLAMAFAAVVLAVVLLLGLSPQARTAIADRLGLRGIDISYIPPLDATASPSETSSAPGAEPGLSARELRLGRPVSLEEARALVPYSVRTTNMPLFEQPDAVYLGGPDGKQIAFVYVADSDARPLVDAQIRFLIGQFVGRTMDDGGAVFGKGIPPDVQIEAVRVNGGRGFWISGKPHAYFYRDQAGRIVEDSVRLAGNTLLWEQGELTLRLEGAHTKEEAFEIASSMR